MKTRTAVGYVPDEDDVDAGEEKAGEKNPHEDAGPKRKSVAKRAHHRAVDPEDVLKNAIAEREEFKDKYLRGLAEMDNFRKRMKKEKEEFQKYVLTRVPARPAADLR